MKKITFLLVAFLLSLFTVSQAQTIPNPGFESWNANEPSSWSTTMRMKIQYSVLSLPVTLEFGSKTTDKYSGTFALQIQPKSIAIPIGDITIPVPGLCQLGETSEVTVPLDSILNLINGGIDIENPEGLMDLASSMSGLLSKGVPFNRIPSTVSAYVKFFPAEGSSDSLVMSAFSTKWNSQTNNREIVAMGYYSATSAINEYTQIIFPMEAEDGETTADSLSIIFMCGGLTSNPGTILLIDQVEFDQTISIKQYAHDLSKIYPNPATEKIFIEPKDLEKEYVVRLYDLNGKKVVEEINLKGKSTIHTSSLNPGVYLLEMKQNELTKTEKLVIQ